jgi:magnesium chelatase family protein
MAGDPDHPCTCPAGAPERYSSRISGPLRDRIDLWITMPRVPPAALVGGREPESSAAVAARIVSARAIQQNRGGQLNGRLAGRRLRAACRLSSLAARRAVELADLEALSGRGTERLLRVARTIADLRGIAEVRPEDLDEASRFRSPAARLRTREAS